MPPLAKKKSVGGAATARSAPKAVPAKDAPPQRPVVYPVLTVNGVPIPEEKMRLSAALLKQLLHWEAEEDYKARCEKSTDQHVRAKGTVGFGDEYLLLDGKGHKVRCWNNLDNRPFDPRTADGYAQDTLNRDWAGPNMAGNETATFQDAGGKNVSLPTLTVNGETIIISRTGKTQSGQHRGVGGILAAERWTANPKAYPQWTEEPFIESLVVFGVSDDTRVVRTLDNVRPRKLGDTIYTSPLFANMRERDRKECSSMLDAAIDLLWKRTGAGGENEPNHRIQTHSSSFDFLDRHGGDKGHLIKCVKHIFEENSGQSGRTFSTVLKLSPGQCAACMYLMGSATTNPDDGYLKNRNESELKWDLWETAEEFFVGLAAGGDRGFKVVAEALVALRTADEGLGGRMIEKIAVLAAAWGKFRDNEEITEEDLVLAYGEDRGGNTVLLDPPTFGGIDFGDDPSPPDKVTKEQAEAAKKEAKASKVKNAIDKVSGKGQGGSATQELAKLKEDHPDALLLFPDGTGNYNAYGPDAEALVKEMVLTAKKGPGGVDMVTVPAAAFEVTIKQMHGTGAKLKTVAYTDGVPTVTELQPRRIGPRPGGAKKTPAQVTPKDAETNGAESVAKPAPKTNGKKKTPALRGGTGN